MWIVELLITLLFVAAIVILVITSGLVGGFIVQKSMRRRLWTLPADVALTPRQVIDVLDLDTNPLDTWGDDVTKLRDIIRKS